MKAYELIVAYANGETDKYYSRLTGGYWETDAVTEDEALDEMRENDPDTFEQLDSNDNVVDYWVERCSELPSLKVSSRYNRIGTFETDTFDGFYVDIIFDTEEQTYDSVLYHERYGIREDMFGVMAADCTVEEYIELVEANLCGYVAMYIDNRESEDGHDWAY